MARASTVEVVVPSPATSLVLEATCLIKAAPRLSCLGCRDVVMSQIVGEIWGWMILNITWKSIQLEIQEKNLEIGQTIYYYICWRLCTQYLGDVEFWHSPTPGKANLKGPWNSSFSSGIDKVVYCFWDLDSKKPVTIRYYPLSQAQTYSWTRWLWRLWHHPANPTQWRFKRILHEIAANLSALPIFTGEAVCHISVAVTQLSMYIFLFIYLWQSIVAGYNKNGCWWWSYLVVTLL